MITIRIRVRARVRTSEQNQDQDLGSGSGSGSAPGSGSRPRSEPQRCRLCNYAVRRNESQVSAHLAEKHDIHEIVCCFCTKSFTSTKQRRNHIYMYHPLRPAKDMDHQPCKECQLFISEREAHDHMEIEHKKHNECPFCPFQAGNIEF